MMVLDMNEGTVLECNSASPAPEQADSTARPMTAPGLQLQEIEFSRPGDYVPDPVLLQGNIDDLLSTR